MKRRNPREIQHFASWLSEQRLERKWTPTEAATTAGVANEYTWLGYEEGRIVPRIDTAIKLAQLFGADPDTVLTMLNYSPEQDYGVYPYRLELGIHTRFTGADLETVSGNVVKDWIADWNPEDKVVCNPNDHVRWHQSLTGSLTALRYGTLNEIVPRRQQEVHQIQYAEYEGPNLSIRFTSREDTPTEVHMQARLVCTALYTLAVNDLLDHMRGLVNHEHISVTAQCEILVDDPKAYPDLLRGVRKETDGKKLEPKGLTTGELYWIIKMHLLEKLR